MSWYSSKVIREQIGLRRSEWRWHSRGRERKYVPGFGLMWLVSDKDYAAMQATVAERKVPVPTESGRSSEDVARLLQVSPRRFKAVAKQLGFEYERKRVAWKGRPVRWHLTEDQMAALREELAKPRLSDSPRNIRRRALYQEARA